MTEYGDAYNWEKTWLNAPPRERAYGKQTLEPHFQHKRHFELEQNDTNILKCDENQAKEISQDPFFIIHGRKHSEMAYPNILYRRAKSAPRESRNPSPKSDKKTPQRPKSDGASETPKHVKMQSKKHHSKSRSRSKEQKKPVERWPELKMNIPSDSPKSKPLKQTDYQLSRSPPLADLNKSDRPQSSKTKVEEPTTKPKPSKPNGGIKKFKSDERLSRMSELEAKSKITSQNLEPEPRKRRFQSEYQANYRDFSDFTDIAIIHNDEARQNQLQVEGCHFSRQHFNQLNSDNVNLWDPPSSIQPEIVGITAEEMSRRLKGYKTPKSRLPNAKTLPDTSFRIPSQSHYRFSRYPASSSTTPYEPQKYLDKAFKNDEPRIKVLPYEDRKDYVCSKTQHYCDRGGNFLISKVRPEEVDTLPHISPVHFNDVSSYSPASLSSSLSLAEQTFDRALRRRNKLLISAPRN
ncbi:unnamed protein product [Rodentolepis nana]|uniref:Nuclear protein MDM1 n=1 Tax=Rodentolepis nana TaxID=102285 RepID=A0A0R3T5I2_RODNA|nr:unnamed protein product [Rodentolepis nana]